MTTALEICSNSSMVDSNDEGDDYLCNIILFKFLYGR